MSGFGVDRGSGSSSGNPDSAISVAVVDAKGDLLVGTADNTIDRLAVGADGTRLVADSAQTKGIKWVADTTNYVVTTKGDLLVATASQVITRLAVGTDNKRLVAASGQATGLNYVADTTNYAITAKGDVLAGTAASTLQAVTVGTDGQALLADSTATPGVAWGTVLTNTSPHRQTQLAGALDSSGYNATFAAGAGLNFNVDASPTNAVFSFANGFGSGGAVDLVTVLTADASNQGSLNVSNTHYLHATRVSASSVTWSHALVPPDYGYAFDRTRGALLNFEAADATTTMVDDFGNTWTAAGNAQIDTAQSKFGTASLLLDGTGDYITSTNYTTLGDGSWEISCWFRLASTAGTQTLFNAGNALRFGVVVNTAIAGVAKLNLGVSSNGSSDDVLAVTAGTTVLVINTWYKARIVFDALAGTYRAYLSNNGAAETQEVTVSSTSRVCAITGIRIGETMATPGQTLNGWVDAFRFIRCATATAAETPSASAPTITDYPYHFFSIPAMTMYSVTAASASAGVNPTLTQTNRIFVGEADTGAATVSALRNYALRGEYMSALTALAGNNNTSFSHNIGVTPEFITGRSIALAQVAAQGYANGEAIELSQNTYCDAASRFVTLTHSRTSTNVGMSTVVGIGSKTTPNTGVDLIGNLLPKQRLHAKRTF